MDLYTLRRKTQLKLINYNYETKSLIKNYGKIQFILNMVRGIQYSINELQFRNLSLN